MSLEDYPIITGVGDGVGVGLAVSSGRVDSVGGSSALTGSEEAGTEGDSLAPAGSTGPGTSVDEIGVSGTIVTVGGSVAGASGDGLSGTTTTVLYEYGVTLGRGVGVGVGVGAGVGVGEGASSPPQAVNVKAANNRPHSLVSNFFIINII